MRRGKGAKQQCSRHRLFNSLTTEHPKGFERSHPDQNRRGREKGCKVRATGLELGEQNHAYALRCGECIGTTDNQFQLDYPLCQINTA